MTVSLRQATTGDVSELIILMRQLYEFEKLPFNHERARSALRKLIDTPEFGRIWIIEEQGQAIGYLSLTFGFALEFGRDAFLDEIFILESHRGKGIGSFVSKELDVLAKNLGIEALHLEVKSSDKRARLFYEGSGFKMREHFHLMTKYLG
ncbi:MAG: GNAT family N-acetyltransferase [Gammaproteobacteria bacterium]|nr:GNAT family N-acetyltransferase [Gammaproteobacteria bacterium]